MWGSGVTAPLILSLSTSWSTRKGGGISGLGRFNPQGVTQIDPELGVELFGL